MFRIKSVYAHCDLPCGVYDPIQAKIEAESILKIMEKYDGLSNEDKIRAIMIKEQRAELVKHHLWVLWTDYFKPDHVEKFPDIHDKFWQATKQAGKCKKTLDAIEATKLIEQIDELTEIFQATKQV